MTATCREACCSVMPRQSVTELFERGYRRNYAAPLSIRGAALIDAEGNRAEFGLELSAGRIAAIGFRATTCATLIAYCEYIAEIVPGFRLELARELTATNLVDCVPGIHALKRDRAVLASAAFRAALVAADEFQRGEPSNESRLHLRHPAP